MIELLNKKMSFSYKINCISMSAYVSSHHRALTSKATINELIIGWSIPSWSHVCSEADKILVVRRGWAQRSESKCSQYIHSIIFEVKVSFGFQLVCVNLWTKSLLSVLTSAVEEVFRSFTSVKVLILSKYSHKSPALKMLVKVCENNQ